MIFGEIGAWLLKNANELCGLSNSVNVKTKSHLTDAQNKISYQINLKLKPKK